MTSNRLQTFSGVSVAAIVLLFVTARSAGQEIDLEYRCVILESLSTTDQTTTPPVSVTEININVMFYVEFWATDSGTTNTGIVSAYTDLDYPQNLVSGCTPGHTPTFSLFADGACDGLIVDELGGSHLSVGVVVGVEPEWVRVAYVEFTADIAGLAGFVMEPAHLESSTFDRGLVPPASISYGNCSVLIAGLGACCQTNDTCTDDVREDDCLVFDGRYLGDGIACMDDPDGDNVQGCDDICPTSPAPTGVDSQGRPLGDVDSDCDVDLVDFWIFQGNFSGPDD